MDNNYLSHEGVKGQKWGYRKKYNPHPRRPKAPNLYPKGPFANYRLKRTLRKSAVKMAKVGYKDVDMGGKIDTFKYRWNMRKIMKQYDGNDFYTELGLNRKEDN